MVRLYRKKPGIKLHHDISHYDWVATVPCPADVAYEAIQYAGDVYLRSNLADCYVMAAPVFNAMGTPAAVKPAKA